MRGKNRSCCASTNSREPHVTTHWPICRTNRGLARSSACSTRTIAPGSGQHAPYRRARVPPGAYSGSREINADPERVDCIHAENRSGRGVHVCPAARGSRSTKDSRTRDRATGLPLLTLPPELEINRGQTGRSPFLNSGSGTSNPKLEIQSLGFEVPDPEFGH